MIEPDPGRPVVDPDVDLRDAGQTREIRTREWDLLAAIAVGGVLGAEARHGLGVLLPHRTDEISWSTVMINMSGCFLIGVLMVVLLERVRPHRLARPFLGVGVLGGYTTFSTFAMDAEHLVLGHRPAVAALYVLITVVGCAVAVRTGTALSRVVGR